MLTHPDQELYRLGILYDENNLEPRIPSSPTPLWSTPVQKSYPAYIIRQSRPRRSRRRPVWRTLPLNLSLSNLRDDYDVARLLYASTTTPPMMAEIHLSSVSISTGDSTTTPQSLPTTSTMALALSASRSVNFLPSANSIPPHSLHHADEDWTFITSPSSQQLHIHPSTTSTPSSELETWILLGDDS